MKKKNSLLVLIISFLFCLTSCCLISCAKKNEEGEAPPESHMCKFVQQVTLDQFKCSEATCTQKAKYYYSCECGVQGIETFEVGDYAMHNVVNGQCTTCQTLEANGLTYKMNSEENGYVITGLGDWNGKELIIPTTYNDLPVCAINQNAFANAIELQKVFIPESIKSIGAYAFLNNTQLQEVDIPNEIDYIGEAAFSGCENLRYYTYANNKYLGNKTNKYIYLADIGNANTSIVEIREGCRLFKEDVFYNCSEATTIILPKSLIFINKGAFKNCNKIEKLQIPFVGESLDDMGKTYVGHVFGARDFYGNISCVPSSLKEIVVTNAISIEKNAFFGLFNLENVTIADSVEYVDLFAFYGCHNLKKATIPTSAIKAITEYGIEEVEIISGESIEEASFAWAENLARVKIAEGLTNIGDSAFVQCDNLTEIIIPKSVTKIGQYAFGSCDKLETLTIPNGVKEIGKSAYQNCISLKTIVIPKSVEIIERNGFYGCDNATILCEVESIPEGWDKSWTNNNTVIWGYKVNQETETGEIKIFVEDVCYNLKGDEATVWKQSTQRANINIVSNITYEGVNYPVTTITAGAFQDSFNLESVTLPEGITSIENSAFYKCINLRSINIPQSVVNIGTNAFGDCYDITEIEIPSSVETIGGYVFDACKSVEIKCEVKSKPNGWADNWNAIYNGDLVSKCLVVWDCNNNDRAEDGHIYTVVNNVRYTIQNDVAIVSEGEVYLRKDGSLSSSYLSRQPSCSEIEILTQIEYKGRVYSVHEIGKYAFVHKGCVSISIPRSIVSIKEWAFYMFQSKQSIFIPKTIVNIDKTAFAETRTIIKSDATEESVGWADAVSKMMVWDCYNNNISEDGNIYVIQDDVLYIIEGDEARVAEGTGQHGLTGFNQRGYAEEVIIPNEISCNGRKYPVTKIGDYAFDDNYNLKSVIIPENVKKIGRGAFSACSNLQNVLICNGLVEIGAYSFYRSGSIVRLVIPDSVTRIGEGAFEDCSIEEVVLSKHICSVGESAFYSDKLSKIYFNGSLEEWVSIDFEATWTYASYDLFVEGELVVSIEDLQVNTIPKYAFLRCASLKELIIPNCINIIEFSAFRYCDSIERVVIPESVIGMEQCVFQGCANLKNITFDDVSTWYYAVSDMQYDKQTGRKVTVTDSSSNVNLFTSEHVYHWFYKK